MPNDAAAAGDALRARLAGRAPRIALILGSGLGGLAARIADAVSVPYGDLPGFPNTAVAGHAGRVVAGLLDGVPVLAFAGRFHLYEGHPPATAALPVRAARRAGVEFLFVSNAAGGVRRTFGAGDLMLIRDHINLMGRNPLIGPVEHGELRFPDMSAPYDPALATLLRSAAAAERVPLQEGVYAGLLGPSYETPAEVRMLERLGADAVGMSTVPEVLAARAMGMRVAGVSCITNPAAGIGGGALHHQDVLDVTTRAAERFERLVTAFVRLLPAG
jgi:purine-nucleoside phosphorylase